SRRGADRPPDRLQLPPRRAFGDGDAGVPGLGLGRVPPGRRHPALGRRGPAARARRRIRGRALMKIGIGLPNTVPGTQGGDMREWAIHAEAAGFSTLGTIDRLVYGNHESLIALSYAAAVTDRIGLLTSMLLGPLRSNNT